MAKQLALIASGPYWKVGSKNKTLYFETREPVTLRYSHQGQSINIKINFGKFRISMGTNLTINGKRIMGTGEEYLEKLFQQDRKSKAFPYHPHLARCGSFCFGNLKNDFWMAQETGSLTIMFDIMRRCLINYYDGNPYTSLGSFKEHMLLIQRREKLPDAVTPDVVAAAPEQNATDVTSNFTITSRDENGEEQVDDYPVPPEEVRAAENQGEVAVEAPTREANNDWD